MKKEISKLIALVLCCAALFSLAACAQAAPEETKQPNTSTEPQQETETGAEPDDEVVVGYIAYSDGLAFSLSITQNIQANIEARGDKLLKTDSNGDATKALAALDTFIEQGADFIIDSTWVDAATQAMAQKCKEAGVPFISIDIPVNEQYADNSYFMGINNYQAGVVTGTAAGEYIKDKWSGALDYILIAYTESTGEALKQRIYGAIDAVRESGIEIDDSKIVWVNPQSTDATVEAKSLTTDFLTAHPDSKHIAMFCVNDQAAMGMYAGVETSGRQADVIVCGQGCDDPGIENLRREDETSWIGSTGYFPETYGDHIFTSIIDVILAGSKPEPNTYVTNVFITRETIDQYYPR